MAGVQLLVLQPSELNSVERLGDWLTENGAELTVYRVAVDGVPDSLDGFDGVVCLGGEMSALQDVDYPWLADIRRVLAAAVSRPLPVLGLCLGGQLLAAATGGAVRVGPDGPEAGIRLVAKRDASAADPLLADAPLMPTVVQHHHDEIHELPPGATLLASSPTYANQAFRVGRVAYGFQFHIEPSADTFLNWSAQDTEAAAIVPHEQRDAAGVESALAEVAEVWQPVAKRFVTLVTGDLEWAREEWSGGRSVLPLTGH